MATNWKHAEADCCVLQEKIKFIKYIKFIWTFYDLCNAGWVFLFVFTLEYSKDL